MSKLAAWLLVIYALAITGLAAYEYAAIQHLQFVLKLLLSGSPN